MVRAKVDQSSEGDAIGGSHSSTIRLASNFRRYVADSSRLAKPLTILTRGDIPGVGYSHRNRFDLEDGAGRQTHSGVIFRVGVDGH